MTASNISLGKLHEYLHYNHKPVVNRTHLAESLAAVCPIKSEAVWLGGREGSRRVQRLLYLTWGSNRYRKAVDMLGVGVVHVDVERFKHVEGAGGGGFVLR